MLSPVSLIDVQDADMQGNVVEPLPVQELEIVSNADGVLLSQLQKDIGQALDTLNYDQDSIG